uniref:Lipoprotein n=1 Tax=Amphora coffeiformis TaxID=265554 RepID=A0A7S3P3S8_9STRA|mmetsp:Transcript_21344/g.40556  ORF Transcript_21344/g.40556 Transcript_21344/m.40556 type:complete len:191 (+) Transcript_21344:183-755(+)|eukprot:scaffold162_cov176-Amphora_coffeaeformis.AAC.50
MIRPRSFSLVLLVVAVAVWERAEALSVERRQALTQLVGGAAAVVATLSVAPPEARATAAKTGSSSPFTGDYDDPNHPGCLRQVKVVGAPLRGDGTRSPIPVMEVVGWDGESGGSCAGSRPTREQLWKLQGKVVKDKEAVIDFSPKGGPDKLVATWDGSGMVFPDGNKWTKVIGGTNDRRPEDMSTLKSKD